MSKEDTSYWIKADGAMWALPITDRTEAEHEVRRLRAEVSAQALDARGTPLGHG